jgi:isopentenyl-diphosphate Delta-isomerase
MDKDYVILVDEHDNELGVMEKMQAHREGKLHRAISVLIINSKKQLLLQQRAYNKYHSPGLWANTCCTHPKQGETPETTAKRDCMKKWV